MASSKEATTEAEKAKEKEVTGGKMITLWSKDGTPFEVAEAAARLSVVLSGVIDGVSTDDVGVPISNIDAATLEKVVNYLNKHAEAADDTVWSMNRFRAGDLREWDAKFIDGLGIKDGALFDLIDAANFLEIDGLLDAACMKIADTMSGKTPEEIRSIFNIVDDYSEQEKAEIRRAYAWAFPENEMP